MYSSDRARTRVVIDVGDGVAIAVRIESHNHPSAVEPQQGAATGVGGILRDVFTIGAPAHRPHGPALHGPARGRPEPLDLRRRRPGHRRLWQFGGGADRGRPGSASRPVISGNPLVNVLCLGVLPIERLVLARATGEGNLAVLLGSLTGRDGIGGVSILASAGLAAGDGGGLPPPGTGALPPLGTATREAPSVQVGDPYEEKRLIEACLALLDAGLVVGIQDLGGAGLTSTTCETASRRRPRDGRRHLGRPRREDGMSPVEIMTSESQERMLAIVEPGNLAAVTTICDKFEIRASVVGHVVAAPPDGGPGRLRVHAGAGGEVLGEVTASSLADDAPRYERPLAPPPDLRGPAAPRTRRPGARAGIRVPICSALCYDPAFVFSQYDHQLFLNTVLGPGEADAAVLRLAGPPESLDRQGPGALDRRQPRLVRDRPASGRGGHGRRVGPQRRLRRRPARGARRLPQLRQPRAPGRHVAALRGRRRHRARPAWLSASRSSAATCRSTTRAPASTSIRRRSSASSGSSSVSSAGHRAWQHRRARRSCSSARPCRSSPGPGGPVSSTGRPAGGWRRSTSRLTDGCATSSRELVVGSENPGPGGAEPRSRRPSRRGAARTPGRPSRPCTT